MTMTSPTVAQGGVSPRGEVTTPGGRSFSKEDIHFICGRIDASDRYKLLDRTSRTLAAHGSQLDAIMDATGFDAGDMARLLHQTEALTGDAIRALHDRRDELAHFMKSSNTAPDRLSIMLSNARAHVVEADYALYGELIHALCLKRLPEYMTQTHPRDIKSDSAPNLKVSTPKKRIFTATNISSACGIRGKDKEKAQQVTSAVFAVYATKLDGFMDATGIAPAGISHILHGSGTHIRESMAGLLSEEAQTTIQALMRETGCSPQLASSILGNSGQHIEEAIEIVKENLPKFKLIVSTYDVKKIGEQLHNKANGNFASKMNELYEQAQRGQDTSGAIPPGANAAIAATSAANVDIGKEK